MHFRPEIKEKYIELIKKAGFRKVEVLQEKTYPIDYILSEPDSKATVAAFTPLTSKDIKEAANSVVSISVSASK